MPRIKRKESRTGIHHVFMRGVGQMDIFKDDDDRWGFMNSLDRAKCQGGFSVIAYCLMTNHIHLLVREQEPLGDSIKRISVSYSRRFNKKYGRSGHLFQGRFGSEPVETGRYLARVVRYIHMNPVKAKIVFRPEDYRWSSYKCYRKVFKGMETGLESDMVKAAFSNWENFRKYTLAEDLKETDFLDEPSVACTAEMIAGYIMAERPKLDWSKVSEEEKRELLLEIKEKLGASGRLLSEVLPIGRNRINRLLKEE